MRIKHNACSLCGGDLHPLGALGLMEYYRCRHCGADSGRQRKPRKSTKRHINTDGR